MPKGVFRYKKPERNARMLMALRQGKSNPAIARELGLSAGTVRIYMSELFADLGASNRIEALLIAMTRGLVTSLAAIDPRDPSPDRQITIRRTRKPVARPRPSPANRSPS